MVGVAWAIRLPASALLWMAAAMHALLTMLSAWTSLEQALVSQQVSPQAPPQAKESLWQYHWEPPGRMSEYKPVAILPKMEQIGLPALQLYLLANLPNDQTAVAAEVAVAAAGAAAAAAAAAARAHFLGTRHGLLPRQRHGQLPLLLPQYP